MILKNMKKVLKSNFQAGSENNKSLRLVGEILAEMLSSHELLAWGYRRFLALKEIYAEKGEKYDKENEE